jgi:predicted ester cyclase
MKKQIYILILMLSTTLLVAQEKKAGKIITDYFAKIDAGKLDEVGTLLTDDFKAWAPFLPAAVDKTAWRGVGQGFNTAFPDMKHEIVSWFADDNMVAAKGIFKGTNTGPMMGNPPTRNKVMLSFTSLFELDGKGKIKSLNIQFDNKAFEAQLMAGMTDTKKLGEKNVRELFDAMDAGKTDEFINYCTSDFTITNPFLPAPSPIKAFQDILMGQKTAFPDMKHEVKEMSSDGKYVVTRGVFTGTNTGSMMGNPPTGNKVKLPFIVMDEVDAKGRIKFRNVQFDVKSFESQLMAGINPDKRNETIIRELMATADRGDAEKAKTFWSDHGHPYFHGVENTQEEMGARVKAFKTAFPDVKRSLEEVIVKDNKVIIRGILTGTNKGSFMGKPATNNPVRVSWLGLYHIKPDGKIENGWVEFDTATLEKQLSKKAKPTTAKSEKPKVKK